MPDTIDFQRLFEASPNPYMLLDRDLKYVAANAAYLRATASRLEDLMGRYIFEAFPHDPDDPNNASARLLRESFDRVLARRAPDSLALIPYRVPHETAQGTAMLERYWSATHTPILDARNEVAFILQHTVEVTGLDHLVRPADATRGLAGGSREQLEAGVLQRAQFVQEANLTLDTERRHLRRLFEQAPSRKWRVRASSSCSTASSPRGRPSSAME